MTFSFTPIAKIYTDFPEKFGVPRQSGLVNSSARIEFEKGFTDPDMLRGIEEFSHLWLLWVFSETAHEGWHTTVRPPKLGGNTRVGVLATRSPYRPNPIGLTCVKLEKVEKTANKCILWVSGADLVSGTPVLDIKPYLKYVDAIEEANDGFAGRANAKTLTVTFACDLPSALSDRQTQALRQLLSLDPRPGYCNDEREYALSYATYTVRFSVTDDTLTVTGIESR